MSSSREELPFQWIPKCTHSIIFFKQPPIYKFVGEYASIWGAEGEGVKETPTSFWDPHLCGSRNMRWRAHLHPPRKKFCCPTNEVVFPAGWPAQVYPHVEAVTLVGLV